MAGSDHEEIGSGLTVVFSAPGRCPGCDAGLEHTGDKLYYCATCCDFFIEIEGAMERYLLTPSEKSRQPRVLITGSAGVG